MVQHPQIHDDASYDDAMRQLLALMARSPQLSGAEQEQLQSLSSLIVTYEKRRWPIANVDAVAFLQNIMGLTGRTQLDLGRIVGSRDRAVEILTRKRHLSMTQIHHIAEEWNIPARMLMGNG